jgi:hypothetical protein
VSKWARRTGIGFQGLVLGTLLFVAVLMLTAVQSGARLFRYQGF